VWSYPQINPVALDLGFFQVHWYGLMYLVGFVAFYVLARLRARSEPDIWTQKRIEDLLFYGALGVILGGRLGYVLFYNFPVFAADPLYLFRVWEGGMSFHGGLMGVITAMFLYGRSMGVGFWRLTDFIAPMVPIGLGAGRIGNFINNELWGKVTDSNWGMSVYDAQVGALVSKYPTQLLQFALEGVALFLILWFYSAKPRPKMAVSGLFLILYGFFRVLAEFWRMPDAQLGYLAWGWVTMGQVLSLPMILLGGVLMLLAYRKGLPSQTVKEAP
jgi:phosphatidylglycerol:prolipoprotein diacylglycerol transferase